MLNQNPDRTVVSPWIGSQVMGYTVNLGFSVENQECLGAIIKNIKDKFPELIWSTPSEKLHITLFEWVASLSDYGRNKDELFSEIYEGYDRALEKVLTDQQAFSIEFTELKVTPDAIIAIGNDNGSFQKIRNAFLSGITLPPGAKPFPKIIHTTLCRFLKEDSLKDVTDAVGNRSISLRQCVNSFGLLKILQTPMLKSELIKEYVLK